MNISSSKLNQFTYHISFKYRKFNDDLRLGDFRTSSLTISVEDPLPEPLLRHWTTIIRELNPEYHEIEILDVKIVS